MNIEEEANNLKLLLSDCISKSITTTLNENGTICVKYNIDHMADFFNVLYAVNDKILVERLLEDT